MYKLLILLYSLCLISCVPQTGTTGRQLYGEPQTNSDIDDNSNPDPTFAENDNFFQYMQTEIHSSLNIDRSYNDAIYLRGKQIHEYVLNHKSDINCIIVAFPNITATQGNSILIMAAKPNSFFNVATSAREYYYLLYPNGEEENKAYCYRPEILNQLNQDYPGKQVTFALSNIAQNSASINTASDSLRIYTQFAQPVSAISIAHLRFNLTYLDENPSDPNNAQTCTSSKVCQSMGLDCCSETGQCVRHGQLKPGVDQNSAEYLMALIDINENPAKISNYPQFFFSCTGYVPTDPNDDTPPSDDDTLDPDVRLADLKDLYDCTTPTEGAMSICTYKIPNVTQDNLAEISDKLKTAKYDLTFGEFYSGSKTSQLLQHSIYQIIYGDKIIYDVNRTDTYNNVTFGTSNFNLYDATTFTINTSLPESTTDHTLRVRYTTDGSCEYVSDTLAKCKITYIQGQDKGLPTDHNPPLLTDKNIFKLPYYADTRKYIRVYVDGVPQAQGSSWNLNALDRSISFVNQLADNEIVEISYYVNTMTYPVFTPKQEAYTEIEKQCNCVGPGCALTPVFTDDNILTAFNCHYPPHDEVDPPLQMDIQLSTKAVPVRFFNTEGKEYTGSAISSGIQEGAPFKYENNDKLKPNNLENYVGFNEIYGTISYTITTADPPAVVDVQRGKSYDIYTELNSGTFSSCSTCGTDYYSQLVKIFPDNFASNGAGYMPDPTETSRFNTSTYRADDLIFGRACFIPVTMIPWTHRPEYDRDVQRQKRLAAQHFLFANGYQRDWYGFNYGAIIGSFDGVNWFAIGNQRRVKATSNKLYLAINAFFGDLTHTSSYEIHISDSTISYGDSYITSDFENDGATCQQYHVCETDQDCITKLGWEYTCQSVTQIKTQWPRFDANAKELIGVSDEKRLIDIIVGGFRGPSKRCVYRGRGVPCTKNYNVASSDNSYAKNSLPGINACMQNNYCESISTENKFNNRIARFARSPKYQNNSGIFDDTNIELADTFGLEARVLGRPFDFNGNENIPIDAIAGLNYNRVSSICIPGHNLTESTFVSTNSTAPVDKHNTGDRVLEIGMTPYVKQRTDNTYYSQCSILDEDGNYLFLQQPTLRTNNGLVTSLAASQSLSSTALEIFEHIDSSLHLLGDFKNETITDKMLGRNSCLRAPGAACHTDLDCGPSPFVTAKLGNIDPNSESTLNSAERRFWKETLVCSQADDPTSKDFDLTKNRCCREVGKSLTIPTQNATSASFSHEIPGYQIGINDRRRLSRFMMLSYERYKDGGQLTSSSLYPDLVAAVDNACGSSCMSSQLIDNQFNTLNYVATNTCCSGHWIRNFDKDENNGGHTWAPNKLQNFNYEAFKCLNWSQKIAGETPFMCNPDEAPDFVNCTAKNISLSEADEYFKFFGTLELLGIPQIMVESLHFQGARCNVDSNQNLTGSVAIGNTTITSATPEYINDDGKMLYSATDMSNFDSTLKKIFAANEITCCEPTGKILPTDATADQCCTGNLVDRRCCLPDYTDVTIYLNRYVSSAAKNLDPSMFDPETGYIKDPNVVEQIAYQEGICCSGSLLRGQVLYNLHVPGIEETAYTVRRFLDGSTPDATTSKSIKQFWDAGARWNNHVYCAPRSTSGSSSSN